MEKFATFKVKDSLIVVDPCYKQEDCFDEIKFKAREGTWTACIESGISIVVYHSALAFRSGNYEEIGGSGVDSGQLGIWDFDFWLANNDCNDYNEVGKWYRNICDLTLQEGGGKYGEGVVCDTGGDGCFPVEVIFDGDEVIAVRVTFMPDEFDDEGDY